MSNLLKDNIELMKEYNNEKNHDIDLNNITLGSNKKIWWKCSKGHEWEASIYSRKNNKCPICSNKMILVGINDLATVNPELAKEWNYEKNGELKPTMVTRGSQKKYGGNVRKVMNGRQVSIIETMVQGVLFVPINKF